MVIAAARVQFKIVAVTPISFITAFLAPLTLAILVISRNRGPTPDLLLGTATAGVWNTVLIQSVRSAGLERAWGTLQVLAVAPTGVARPLVGRLVGILGQGLVTVPLSWVVVALAWGPPRFRSAPLVMGGLIEATVGLGLMGVMLISINIRFHAYSGVFNGVFPFTVVLMGLFLPVGLLPSPLHWASVVFPPTWAVEAVRQQSYWPLFTGVITLIGWAALVGWLLARLDRWLRSSPASFAM